MEELVTSQKRVIMNKIDALTKTLLYEKVAVIHAAFEDVPRTVAMVKVLRRRTLWMQNWRRPL